MTDDPKPPALPASLPSETFAALQTKHGADAVHVLGEGAFAMVFRTPSRAAWRTFRALAGDPGRKASAPEKLVSECLLWPDGAAADALFDRRPALVDVYTGELAELAGAGDSPLPKR